MTEITNQKATDVNTIAQMSTRKLVDVAFDLLMDAGSFDARVGRTEKLYDEIRDAVLAVEGLKLNDRDDRFEILLDKIVSRLRIARPSNATLRLLLDTYAESGQDLVVDFFTGVIRDVVDRSIIPFSLIDEFSLLDDDETFPQPRSNISISRF